MAGGPVGGGGPNRVIEFAVDKRLIAADGVAAATAFSVAFLFAPQQAYADVQPIVWASAVSGQTPRLIPQIVGGPQVADLTQQPFFKSPTPLKQGPVPPPTFGAPQPDPSQLAASVWRSVVVWQTTPVILRVSGAPQLLDLTQQAVIAKPLTTPQGLVPPLTAGASQVGPSQTAAVIWKSQPAAPIVANPIANFVAIPPQADPSRLSSQVWQSLSTPPIVAGVTVWPNAAIPPQFDTSINASMLWTPSTFSPSAPAPFVDVTPAAVPAGRIYRRRYIMPDGRMFEATTDEVVALLQLYAKPKLEDKPQPEPRKAKGAISIPTPPVTLAKRDIIFLPAQDTEPDTWKVVIAERFVYAPPEEATRQAQIIANRMRADEDAIIALLM